METRLGFVTIFGQCYFVTRLLACFIIDSAYSASSARAKITFVTATASSDQPISNFADLRRAIDTMIN